MFRTIQIPLPYEQELIDTIKLYNRVVQEIINIGWKYRTYNKNKLHKLTYFEIRAKYSSLQSSLIQCAKDQASDILKREKFKHSKPIKRELSGIRYNKRTFTIFFSSKRISLSTIAGRKKYNLFIPEYFTWYEKGEIKSLTLRIKSTRRIIGYISIELPNIPIKDPKSFLGVDRGIKRVAVLSNNLFYDSKHIRKVKWKYQRLRNELQSKGTKSARRKLKKIAGKERRFMTDENRKIAKWVLEQPFDCVVLEKLKGIKHNSKKCKKVNKKVRKQFANWSYYQLERFIIERAEKLGKYVLFIRPDYTSQRCSECGYISKGNRKSQSKFCCKECGFQLNADLNASINISELGKAVFRRASVNSPNVGEFLLKTEIFSLEKNLPTSSRIHS